VLQGAILTLGRVAWSHMPSSTVLLSCLFLQMDLAILVPPPQEAEQRDRGTSLHSYLSPLHEDPSPPQTPHWSRSASDRSSRSQPTSSHLPFKQTLSEALLQLVPSSILSASLATKEGVSLAQQLRAQGEFQSLSLAHRWYFPS